MRPLVRPILLPVVAATLFMAAAARPAAAQCVVAAGDLASGASIIVTAPPGHTYTFTYTGAASGTLTVTGTVRIQNGTLGVLHYVITDDRPCEPVPTLSGPMLALMALIFAGLGVLFMRLRR